MADQFKNMMIGLFVIAACAIVIFTILFLHPSVGNEGRVLRVRFANIDKVNIGTRVNFAGKPVGEVVAIREIEDAVAHRKSYHGLVYVYELKLRVDTSVNVYSTDQISLRTSGLLGEKSVSIEPQPLKPGEVLRLVNNDIIYAVEVGNVEDTLKQIQHLGNKIENTLDSITESFEEIKKHKIVEKAGATIQNLYDITKALNQPESLSHTLTNIHELSYRAVQSWEKMDHSLDQIYAAASNAREITFDGKTIMNKIKRGEGTAGQILVGNGLYLKFNAILSKANILMNDVNRYGLLFNLDKGWQRLKAQRLNLLNRLASPQEFQNYFSDEMDQISTSLARVSMVLDDECLPPCKELLQNQEFAQTYTELLKKVADMEEALRMYNQQLHDLQERKTEIVER